MAQDKKARKILSDDMSILKKSLLLQTTLTPGFKVIVEMANDACLRFTQDIVRLDPESPEYERIVAERQRRARYASEFSDLLFQSVFEHAGSIQKQETQEEQEAEEIVSKSFGIHPAVSGTPVDAITKTFGIHPAKPKKKSAEQK